MPADTAGGYAFRRQRNLYTDASTYKRAGKASKLISDETRRANLHKSFCMFDRNTYTGEGRLTVSEMLEVGAYMREEAGFTKEDNKKLVEAMDENNDGVITFQEFLNFNKDVLYELSDEEFERVDKRFRRMAKEAQASRVAADALDDNEWYMFGSENSAIQALRRQRYQHEVDTIGPPRRTGLTMYEKRMMMQRGELPPPGTRQLGPRRTGYWDGEGELQPHRIWKKETPIPRRSDCFTALPKKTSSREELSGFNEAYSNYRMNRPVTAPEPASKQWDALDDMEYHLRGLTDPDTKPEPVQKPVADPNVYGFRSAHYELDHQSPGGLRLPEEHPEITPIVIKTTADHLGHHHWLDEVHRGQVVDFKLSDIARPDQYRGRIENPPLAVPYTSSAHAVHVPSRTVRF